MSHNLSLCLSPPQKFCSQLCTSISGFLYGFDTFPLPSSIPACISITRKDVIPKPPFLAIAKNSFLISPLSFSTVKAFVLCFYLISCSTSCSFPLRVLFFDHCVTYSRFWARIST